MEVIQRAVMRGDAEVGGSVVRRASQRPVIAPGKDIVEVKPDPNRCINCGKTDVTRCDGCGKVAYCSRKCRRTQAWKTHAKECGKEES